MEVGATVDKVGLLALLELGLYRPRAVRVVHEAVLPLLEPQQAHQQALVLAAAVVEAVAEKAQDVSLATVTVAVAAVVVINRVAELLVVGKARLHSPQAQMAHLAAVAAVVVLVTIAKLVAAVLAFY